jgi:hypothetical protein
MAILKDAWVLFLDEFKSQRALDKKRREYVKLTQKNLDYPLLESITQAAAKQQPGFYSVITFADGARWEFGVRTGSKASARNPDETF